MDASRNDLIRELLGIFDTVDNLRFDNMRLRDRVAMLESTVPGVTEIGALDEHVMAYGREELVKKAMPYWNEVKVTVNDDDGEVVGVESFEDWCSRHIRKSEIPSWCSWDDFIEYFNAELRSVYDKERESAIAELRNEGE